MSTLRRVEIRSVTKVFYRGRARIEALGPLDLVVTDREFLSIVGPSGCGKSTLLNIVAGLEEPSSGEVWLDGAPAPHRLGRVAYMHQRDLLLPWRRVLDNVILPLELRGVPKHEARHRALPWLERFGLAEFAAAYPAQLSGGMRQRVAFLRTLMAERPLLLLDEPFGALDALTRASLQEWLLALWEELDRTIVLVTHDVEEAILLSDRVIVLSERPGRIVDEVPVALPRPRTYEIVTDPRFVALKARVLGALRARSAREVRTDAP
ncbi:ABC transporter ATP-binding protein [Thermomicrobium sp. 4228-Ro]|uniref:ABC transporter ATP-binding protein n=1 Tax=Thermomicrobium sp. 4228-Ro TaxID=2993937 RepID=UPI0022487A84|nr:ABC transporter ATP-binding protein [Thermomicrobium sp. 4228-Ro]MCX2726278.1 ABC transporter ATP-binding protein [Thermomicrobium sp. 4228-Ro]